MDWKLGVATICFLATGAVMSAHWVVLEVQDRDTHLRIPAPVAAVAAVAGFSGAGQVPARIPKDLEAKLPAMREILGEIRTMPDALLVTIEDGPDRVLIEKRGGALVVNVDHPAERVRIRIPLEVAERVMESLAGGDSDLGGFLNALRHSSGGELAVIESKDSRVRIRTF